MRAKRIEAGKYEITAHGHLWTVERWVADESLWIGYAVDLSDECVGPMDTKAMIVAMIENWKEG